MFSAGTFGSISPWSYLRSATKKKVASSNVSFLASPRRLVASLLQAFGIALDLEGAVAVDVNDPPPEPWH